MKLSMKIAACENNKSKYTHTDYYNLLIDDYYKPTLIESRSRCQHCESKVDKDKNLSLKQYLLMIVPHLPALINEHENESNEWRIQLKLHMCISNIGERQFYPFCLNTNDEEIRSDVQTNEIVYKLLSLIVNKYQEKKEESRHKRNSLFESISLFSYHICKVKDIDNNAHRCLQWL